MAVVAAMGAVSAVPVSASPVHPRTYVHPSWSPDAKLQASFTDSTGLLTVRSLATGRISWQAQQPAPDPRTGFSTQPSWSPDGTEIVFAEGASDDEDFPPFLTLFLVDAATGRVTHRIASPCGDDAYTGAPQWVSGDAFGVTCTEKDLTVDPSHIVASTGIATAVATIPALSFTPSPTLAFFADSVTARATGPGQVTITAQLQARDNAGAEVTAGGVDYGRLLGGSLTITGLPALHSFSFVVVPLAWNGSNGGATTVTASTTRQAPSVTTVTAPKTALAGSTVTAKVRVTRSGNGHGLAHRVVTLRAKLVTGQVVTIGQHGTDAHGYASFSYVERDDTRLTATAGGDPTFGGSVSATVPVVARIRLHVVVGAKVALHRVVTITASPARLLFGLEIETTAGRQVGPACATQGATIVCPISAGSTRLLVPLGPLAFQGQDLPAGPTVTVEVPA